jgi:hypothetical protein
VILRDTNTGEVRASNRNGTLLPLFCLVQGIFVRPQPKLARLEWPASQLAVSHADCMRVALPCLLRSC